MKISMLVKCEKCGYENFPQHRFCGMCAAELALPTAPPARPSPAPQGQSTTTLRKPVSPPSPTRLEREPVDPRSVSYLLEDEPEPSHWGRYLLWILLVGALAAGGWHWREDLGALVARVTSGSAGASAQPNSSTSDATSPESVPASGASPGGEVEKPGTGSQTMDQTAPAQSPPTTAPAAGSASTGDGTQSSQADQSKPSDQTPPSDSAAAAAATRPAAPPVTTADDLASKGEKYLYGNGVPENCGLARKNLLAAAQRSNATAQNVLGTMYATGHCATRDLPTAYRWFSRSLRKDPGNTRIEQDLKVLWNQMTPEERKLALRDQR